MGLLKGLIAMLVVTFLVGVSFSRGFHYGITSGMGLCEVTNDFNKQMGTKLTPEELLKLNSELQTGK